jgi:hypothetical protein
MQQKLNFSEDKLDRQTRSQTNPKKERNGPN